MPFFIYDRLIKPYIVFNKEKILGQCFMKILIKKEKLMFIFVPRISGEMAYNLHKRGLGPSVAL